MAAAERMKRQVPEDLPRSSQSERIEEGKQFFAFTGGERPEVVDHERSFTTMAENHILWLICG
jgi:hypothetical protein